MKNWLIEYAANKNEFYQVKLINQLERNGVHGNHYSDLINDYLCMYDIKNQLIRDIRRRGVSVPYQNGPSQSGFKKNDSIAELTRTSGQMLRILNELGLRVRDIEPANDDDEEL